MTARFVKLDARLLSRADVPPAAKVVHAVVVDHLNAEGVAWLGIRRIATLTGMDGKLVQRALRRLEESSLIVVERRGCGRTNLYRLPAAEKDRSHDDHAECSHNDHTNRSQNDHGQNSQPWSNCPPGVVKTTTEAWSNRPQTQKDLKNQTARASSEKTKTAKSADSQPTLIDVGDTPKQRKASDNGKVGAHQRVIEHHAALFAERFGVPYRFRGKADGAAIARLVSHYGGDAQRASVHIDLALEDPWFAENGRCTLTALSSDAQLNKFGPQVARRLAEDNGHSETAPLALPVVYTQAVAKWPDAKADIKAHRDEWRRIVDLHESGSVPFQFVNGSKAGSAAQFRTETIEATEKTQSVAAVG